MSASVFDVLVCRVIVAASGWLTIQGAVALTVLLLGSLIVFLWIHRGQGRHSAFLLVSKPLVFSRWQG